MELLTLQQTCMLFLVTHLDRFSPKTLHLLPRRLRYELLGILPPADICWLEKTGAVEGLDMNRVWSHAFERCSLRSIIRTLCDCARSGTSSVNVQVTNDKYPCVCQLPPDLNQCTQKRLDCADDDKSVLTWRQCFANVISSLVLSPSQLSIRESHQRTSSSKRHSSRSRLPAVDAFEAALQILFSGQTPSRLDLSSYNSISLLYCGCCVRPARIMERLSSLQTSRADQTQAVQLMQMMVWDFDLLPKSLCIDHKQSSDPDVEPVWAKYDYSSIVGHFLGMVKVLKLCLRGNFGGNSHGYCVIKCILSLPSPSLESLRIAENDQLIKLNGRSHSSLIKNTLVSLAPLLTHSSNENTAVLQKDNCTFSGFRDFQVSSNYKLEYSNFHNAIATKELMNIVSQQKNLESLVVSGCWGWSSKVHSMSILHTFCGSLFGSHLSLVHLKDLDIPAPILQILLRAFLQTFASHKQTFILQSVWMYETDEFEFSSFPSNSPAECSKMTSKSLHLLSMHVPNYFLSWLSTLTCLCVKNVELSDIQYDPDMRPGGLIGVLGSHKDCRIESVSVSCHTADCPSEALDLLMKKGSLHSVTLVEPKAPLLSSLVRGLRAINVQSNSSLFHLAVKKAVLDNSMCQCLFDALHQFPQFSEMTIDLSGTVFLDVSDDHHVI